MAWEDPDEKKLTPDEIKASVSLRTVLEAFGIDVGLSGKIQSPYNEADNTPSCHIYDDGHFWDFSTGRGGDVIDLVQAFTDKNWQQAVEWLGKLIQFNGAEPVDIKTAAAKRELVYFDNEWSALGSHWTPEMQAFIRERWGLYATALSDVGVKADGDTLYIPHWYEGHVVGIKVRRIGGEKTATPGSTFTTGLYKARVNESSTAVVCEGEPDSWAMRWMTAGMSEPSVYAMPTGAGTWHDVWSSYLKDNHEHIWVCTDNDTAGVKAREKITKSLNWDCHQLMVPTLYNDVADAYKAGWRWSPKGEQPTHKVCATCSVDKPLTDFYAHQGAKDGHYNKCKDCHNAERRVNERQRWSPSVDVT